MKDEWKWDPPRGTKRHEENRNRDHDLDQKSNDLEWGMNHGFHGLTTD